MTPAHWTYLVGAFVIVVAMIMRKNIVMPSIVFTILVAWVYKGSLIFGLQSLFNASLYAATQLFNVFLIITLMVAMLKAASTIGADKFMIQPVKKTMVNPFIAYLILIVATFLISLFFWPTPAIPLVGALLIPAAVRVGLTPMTAAIAVAMAGQGMALAGDLVLQAAPKITASAAGISAGEVLSKAGVLTIVTGIIALALAYIFQRKEDAAFARKSLDERAQIADGLFLRDPHAGASEVTVKEGNRKAAIIMAIVIPVVLVLVIIAMLTEHIVGGDATALLGGVAAVLLIVLSFLYRPHQPAKKYSPFTAVSDHLVDGFTFAFRAMGPVVPIAGFFYLGGPDGAAAILGKGAPGFLFDAALRLGNHLPPGSLLTAFGVLILGMLTGLDGSGFAGLPLVGSVAGAIGHGHIQTIAMLGAVGQMGAVWTGGGTLVVWSTLVAVAGIAGVDVQRLAKKNLIPVLAGLVVSTILATLLW